MRKNAKILIVDDKPQKTASTREILKSLNAEIYAAFSGKDALQTLLHHEFAVVLLNVKMPDMNGFEIARVIRSNDSIKNTPIVFVTEIDQEERCIEEIAAIGAIDYVLRSINPKILISKVRAFINLFFQQLEFKKTNEELNQRNKELEKFTHICSHDLQEPARLIANFSEILFEKVYNSVDKESLHIVEVILKNSRRMKKLIGDILIYLRAKNKGLSLESIDCRELLVDVWEDFKAKSMVGNAEIQMRNLPVIHSNRFAIDFVVRNMINNSLKFRREDTKLFIEVHAIKKNDYWEFSICDNGVGISQENESIVFEIFRRIHTSEDHPGSGIALCICKKFIEELGGEIWFESKNKNGANFYFSIPIISSSKEFN